MGRVETIWFRTRSSWPRLRAYLASAGINLLVLVLFVAMPRSPAEDVSLEVIPVTLVEEAPQPEAPEPEPEPEPESELEESVAPEEDRPAEPVPREKSPPPQGPQSPIIAAPGETADAQASTDTLPALPGPQPDPPPAEVEQATAALQAFRCNRFGTDRPAFCDGQEDPIEAPAVPAFAEQPEMSPKAWADFEIEQVDTALQRLVAEDCPPGDGVINDVYVATTNPYLQGAAGAFGSLSANSANPDCG